MSTSPRRWWRLVAVSVVALAVLEQLLPVSLIASRLTSHTQVYTTSQPRGGDLVSTRRIERPLLRWVPFVKYGETVYTDLDQSADSKGGMQERRSTTRTRLLVVGFCSTARYNRLADAPHDKARADRLREQAKTSR